MGISSLVQLASSLFGADSQVSQTSTQDQSGQPRVHHHHHHDSDAGDRYTPSSDSADSNASNASQNVSSFQYESLSFSALNISTLPAPAASAANSTAATAPGDATTTASPTSAVADPTPATASTAADATTQPASATGAAAATASSNQDPLQAVNAQLSSLGLSNDQIQAFDQVANLILQFSPAAFQDLVNQLSAFASQFAAQTSAAASDSSANASPGLQLTELSVRFSGLNETLSPTGQSSGAASTEQISAFKLQVQEVSLTLSDSTGQSTQIQVPQPGSASSANAVSGASQTTQAAPAAASDASDAAQTAPTAAQAA